jgi:hypothetical protein
MSKDITINQRKSRPTTKSLGKRRAIIDFFKNKGDGKGIRPPFEHHKNSE